MIEDHEYEDESDDPEIRFVRLEAKFRAILQRNLAEADAERTDTTAFYIEYMTFTAGASDEYGLDIVNIDDVPSVIEQSSRIYVKYQDFIKKVNYRISKIKISNQMKNRGIYIYLDSNEKEKIRFFVSQIKSILDKSSLDENKKEQLFDKINEFIKELDKDRTALQACSDFIVSCATIAGTSFEVLEPAWKWFCKLAELFGAKAEQAATKLPRSTRRPQIEGPKDRLPKQQQNHRTQSSMDDDIPF